jgi:hypothetical protein
MRSNGAKPAQNPARSGLPGEGPVFKPKRIEHLGAPWPKETPAIIPIKPPRTRWRVDRMELRILEKNLPLLPIRNSYSEVIESNTKQELFLVSGSHQSSFLFGILKA